MSILNSFQFFNRLSLSNVISFLFLVILLDSSQAFSKIIRSEFLNQAILGAEGAQIAEMEFAGQRVYLLSYIAPEKVTKTRVLSHKEYQSMQLQMKKILEFGNTKSKKTTICDRELVYTKVEEVIKENSELKIVDSGKPNKVTTQSLCWETMGPQKRLNISNWFIKTRKSIR